MSTVSLPFYMRPPFDSLSPQTWKMLGWLALLLIAAGVIYAIYKQMQKKKRQAVIADRAYGPFLPEGVPQANIGRYPVRARNGNGMNAMNRNSRSYRY